jgi:ribulose-5-phosphate 4-epimerase/fuculose-1-phosphate aldolase
MATAATKSSPEVEAQARTDLAAAHRLAVMDGLHEGSWNHMSMKIPGKDTILISPQATHWSRVKASNLVELGRDDQPALEAKDDMLWIAYQIHAPIHWARPDVQAALHVHSPHVLALSMLEDGELGLSDQNALDFHGRTAYTETYDGEEFHDIRHGEALAEALGDNEVLILRNHGALVVGPTIGEAYTDLYVLERAARALILALSTGRALSHVPTAVADEYVKHQKDMGYKIDHFEEMKRVLDEREPNFRD